MPEIGPRSLLDVREVAFDYPDQRGRSIRVIENMSFAGHRGETIAVIGRSGIGKTTLCRILAGLLRPRYGSVFLEGQELLAPTSSIAISFQESPCFPWLTVTENIGFAHRNGASPKIQRLIRHLGLETVRDHYPKDLSGGMRQRVAIGRALAVGPLCLILDEPFSALDIVSKKQIQMLVKQEQQERDLLVITVLHSLEDAFLFADRLLVMGSRPATISADIAVKVHADYHAILKQITTVLEDSA